MKLSLFSSVILALSSFPFSNAGTLQFELERREVPKFNKLRRRGFTQAPVYNAQGDLLYLVNVTVGNPPQSMQLQLDTGSSDVWLPYTKSQPCASITANRCAEGAYDPSLSSSSKLISSGAFQISYVDGTKITGDYIADDFAMGGTTIKSMTMGLARSAVEQESSSDFTGIVGVGFEQGEAIYAASGKTYPNLLSMLKTNGVISAKAFSLWLNDKENGVGNILFGGVDTTKFSGDLVSLPIQPDSRSNSIISFTVALDGISVTDATKAIAYAQNNLTMPVILDSGTTITYLPDQISQDLQTGVGAVNSASYGLVVPCTLKSSPATINFRFGNANGPIIVAPISQFVLDFPAGFPAPTFKSNGALACRWGIAASAGRPNLFGDTFLRGAYVVYNLDKSEVAIANAVLNATSSNIVQFSATDIPGVSSTAKGLAVTNTATGSVINTIASGTGSITAAPSGSTFNLGPTSSATASGSGNGKKGGASTLSGPRYPEMMLFVGLFTTLCVLFGGSFVLFL